MTHFEPPAFAADPNVEFTAQVADFLARAATEHAHLALTDEQVSHVLLGVSSVYSRHVERRTWGTGARLTNEELSNFQRVTKAVHFATLAYRGSRRRYQDERDASPMPSAVPEPITARPAAPKAQAPSAASRAEEDLIAELETDLDLRQADYEAGKDVLERLFVKLQGSALGRKYAISGEVDSPEYCRTFDGFISCNIEVQLRPGHALDLTLAIRPDAQGWTVQRYQMDDDEETVTIRHEDELINLTHDLLRHVSRQATTQFSGDQ